MGSPSAGLFSRLDKIRCRLEPDHIAWYINGVKCGEFTDSAQIENGPMQLILNIMVDNYWERDWNSLLADQTLVNQLEVDYIRVYQQQ